VLIIPLALGLFGWLNAGFGFRKGAGLKRASKSLGKYFHDRKMKSSCGQFDWGGTSLKR